ncbi:hypothetical protein SPWS13_0501 [Shewanella putrefaciens]|nr:hypothetical protein SPWS13_0501 [Shewanella putrefaciens]
MYLHNGNPAVVITRTIIDQQFAKVQPLSTLAPFISRKN